VTSRRVFLLSFVAYFLLAGAWALALPVNGTYDEKQHLVRAYAVWTGQFLPHERTTDASGLPTDGVDGPRSLLPENADCTWRPKPPKPASCQRPVTDHSHTVMPSSAARYSPVYYLAVGLPLRLSPDPTGLIWARLLSAALSALLLAAAAAVAVGLGRKLMIIAIVLVSTPLVMNLAGAVNPNGLEITSGVLLFVAFLGALERRTHRLWLLAGVAFAILAAALHLGVVLGALAVLGCLLLTGRFEVLKDRAAWLWCGVPAAAGAVYAVVWLLASSVTDISGAPAPADPMGSGAILRGIVDSRAEFYARQVIGQFGYGETTISLGVVVLWYLLCAAVVGPVLWFGPNRVRAALGGLFLACGALLVGLELHFAPLVGWYAHSRYVMPLGVGIVIGAAFAVMGDGGRYPVLPDRLILGLVVLTVPMDVYALARVMTRFQVGIGAGLRPFGGSWHPAVGSTVPLVACFVGGVLLSVMVKISSVRRVSPHSTVNTLSN
jgi:hypothetical protein